MDDFDKPPEPWEQEDMRRLRKGLLERPYGGSMTAVPEGGFRKGELTAVATARDPGKSIVIGWRQGKPIFDLALVGSLSRKTTMLQDRVLKEIREGRAYGLIIGMEMTERQVRSRLGVPDSDSQG